MAADEQAQRAEERVTLWVREHARSVRGYLLGLVRRPDMADDLTQEVFQRAWQARDRYRDEGHQRAYLLKIADRLVIDCSRRQRLEINVDEAAWHETEPVARTEAPLDELARAEGNEELAAVLDRLSPAQRRVLLLRFFGDLSFEEIAATLGCPLGTALSHCRRGLAAMRQLMAADKS